MNTLKTYRISPLSWLPLLAFATCVFLYFSFFGDYVLFYQEKFSLFIFSFDFLKENLQQPGGLLSWLGKLFSTFFYNPFAGALVIAVILSLVVCFISAITRLLTGQTSILLPMFTGLMLFYVHADYQFFIFNSLGLLLQIITLYISIRSSKTFQGWIPLISGPLLYLVTGGFAWILMVLFTLWIAFGSGNKKWIRLLLFWSISFLTFYISKEFFFFQSTKILLTFPFSKLNTGAQHTFFLLVCGLISLLPLLSKIKIRLPEKLSVPKPAGFLALAIVIIVVMSAIGYVSYDKKTSNYFYVEKLFYQQEFEKIIAFNTIDTPTNQLTIFLNNIALCETNQLNDKLFFFPQSSDGATLFLKWEMIGEILRRGGYFYYSIGIVNEAHRWAFENMVMKGHTPEGLKMLIKTEIINGNYKVASRYINLLKKTIFYRKEAFNYGRFLFNDRAVNDDPELGEKRRTRLQTDFFAITDDPYINLGRTLMTDSLNKKAFDYLMAILLIKKDYKSIAAQLPKYSIMGYTRLPVHVEEAAVALSLFNDGKLPYLGNLQADEDTDLRWTGYLTVFQQYGNDPKRAEPALRKQFGNTFWYWAFYK